MAEAVGGGGGGGSNKYLPVRMRRVANCATPGRGQVNNREDKRVGGGISI